MPHVITGLCDKDKACVAACPTNCIYETPQQLVINPEECIDCGTCVDACPQKAIFPADDLPAEWKKSTEVNAAWFKTGEKRTPATA
jgi:ferredoxin